MKQTREDPNTADDSDTEIVLVVDDSQSEPSTLTMNTFDEVDADIGNQRMTKPHDCFYRSDSEIQIPNLPLAPSRPASSPHNQHAIPPPHHNLNVTSPSNNPSSLHIRSSSSYARALPYDVRYRGSNSQKRESISRSLLRTAGAGMKHKLIRTNQNVTSPDQPRNDEAEDNMSSASTMLV